LCGRFALFDEKEIKEINEIIEEIEQRKNITINRGEIFPTDLVPAVAKESNHQIVDAMIWGFPHFKGSGVIINARSETAHEKPMFHKHLASKRCLIPSTGFYEWSKKDPKNRTKYLFQLPDTPVLYMAGLYNEFYGKKRFVILTTNANDSLKDIHDRMPVIVRKEYFDDWLNDMDRARALLQSDVSRPLLVRREAVVIGEKA